MNVMKLVRRTHLYTGLFLAPWVAMYGLSGLIFNHGDWFSPGAGGATPPPTEWNIDSATLPQWPGPGELACKVIAALNAAENGTKGQTEYRPAAESTPELQGDMSLKGQDGEGGSVHLSFNVQALKGMTSRSLPGPADEQIKLETNHAELLNATRSAMLVAAGKADEKLTAAKWEDDGDYPRLSFTVEHGTKRRKATYDLRSGLVNLSPALEPRSLRAPDFLTSLHLSHGYPQDRTTEKLRTVRAVFVDAMAILMCFWAVSGIAMWLQIKRLRRPGLLVAIASLLATIIVWSAMYRSFTSS